MVLFRLVGYRPLRIRVELRHNDTLQLDAALVRESIQQLVPIEVTGDPARPRGIGREAFEERRRLGFGRFIDSTELRRNEHRRLSDVLRTIPGVNLVRFQDCADGPRRRCGPMELRAASGRGETSMIRSRGREYCWMSIILDGASLYTSASSSPPPDLSRDIYIADLESVEVYRSASEAPVEFSGASGQCGVIVLWSRRG
ncbi:MAG: TonB-dependent receptor plug domain-containing protein [Gemmatimonadales bacterium]